MEPASVGGIYGDAEKTALHKIIRSKSENGQISLKMFTIPPL